MPIPLHSGQGRQWTPRSTSSVLTTIRLGGSPRVARVLDVGVVDLGTGVMAPSLLVRDESAAPRASLRSSPLRPLGPGPTTPAGRSASRQRSPRGAPARRARAWTHPSQRPWGPESLPPHRAVDGDRSGLHVGCHSAKHAIPECGPAAFTARSLQRLEFHRCAGGGDVALLMSRASGLGAPSPPSGYRPRTRRVAREIGHEAAEGRRFQHRPQQVALVADLLVGWRVELA